MCEDNGNGVSHASPPPETCSSQGESSELGDIETKTSLGSSNTLQTSVQLKLLVPSNAAGSIIGRSGRPITEIQERTGAKVKMSKKHELYPGTNDRVCIIIGTIEAVIQVYDYISEKVFYKPDVTARDSNRETTSRHKQVKIIVPNSTAGMIIGKKGSFIKDLQDKTKTFIQISQKAPHINLPERTVVVTGELEETRSVVSSLVRKIAEDPQHGSCSNLTYSDSGHYVASAYSSGSPFAEPSRMISFNTQIFSPTSSQFSQFLTSAGSNSPGIAYNSQPSHPSIPYQQYCQHHLSRDMSHHHTGLLSPATHTSTTPSSQGRISGHQATTSMIHRNQFEPDEQFITMFRNLQTFPGHFPGPMPGHSNGNTGIRPQGTGTTTSFVSPQRPSNISTSGVAHQQTGVSPGDQGHLGFNPSRGGAGRGSLGE